MDNIPDVLEYDEMGQSELFNARLKYSNLDSLLDRNIFL